MDASPAEVADNRDPAERLAALGYGYVRFALANKEVFQLMFNGDVQPQQNERLAAAAKAAYLRLTDGVERVMPQGSPAAKRALADLAWASVHGFAMLVLGGQFDQDDPAEAAFRHRLDLLLEGVAAAIASR